MIYYGLYIPIHSIYKKYIDGIPISEGMKEKMKEIAKEKGIKKLYMKY